MKANFKPLQTRIMNFLIWKFRFNNTHFHSFLVISNPLLFAHCCCYSNCNSNISTHWKSSNSVQKSVDLTTPAKNRRKMSTVVLHFKSCSGSGRLVWYWPSKSPLQSLIFVKCKCPNIYSVLYKEGTIIKIEPVKVN